ncbi:MAG TPA: DUF2752 domain-containing protein [Chloroflexia bacterium]|nr:DUF2752 domain-containing protein [Chloroflexia bacterium]
MPRDARFAVNFLKEAIGLTTPRGRLIAVSALAAFLRIAGPGRLEQGPSLCLIRLITGRPCPACGMTRACAALLQGQPRKAARYNKLIFPVVAVLMLVLFRDLKQIKAEAQLWKS